MAHDTKLMHISHFLWVMMIHYFSYHLFFFFLLFLPSALKIPGPSATRARSHQPVHLQPAGFYGWAGVGEHAEASGSCHLHEDTEGCQWGQQRSWFCQVHNDNDTNVTWKLLKVICFFSERVLQCICHWMSLSLFMPVHESVCACVCVYTCPLMEACACAFTQTHGYQQLPPCPYSIATAAVFPPPGLSVNSLFLFLLRKVSTSAC